MQSKAKTVAEYLKELPADRREAVQAVRKVILANLDKGFVEQMSYGGICYCVPHSLYPAGYHCDPRQALPYAGIGSQKNHIGIYLMCLYNDPADLATFQREWRATGKKLDMGKSCVRFRKFEDVPLEVVGRAVKRVTLKKFIEHYEKNILSMNKAAAERAAAKKKAAGKAGAGTKKAGGKAKAGTNTKAAKSAKKKPGKKTAKR
ncbi:MAG: DUF1801 domain-containing protein [Phycisphaeraceae bacterium]|nr:DUF1801 domain-containing protein [Phycisphaeraceae bacterium]